MRRILTLLCLALASLVVTPRYAAAGGTEFPASGTRNLGRGGTGLARADDPTLMLRNPALLADLWEDMAYTGLNVVLPKACFQATGSNAWGGSGYEPADFGDGPVLVSAGEGFTRADGTPLPPVKDEPYPNVCYTGPVPLVPTLALSMKLAPNLGVGIGFFPPDGAALPQWGNRDGTVNTDAGLRPSPSRWFRAHLNTSYFSALGAVGWRPAKWLSIGVGFQWQAVVFAATQFSRPDRNRSSYNDVRTDVIGRDLFIPGVIASAQITPIDNLDIALGFKWSDRLKSIAKLDVTTGNFASGTPIEFIDTSDSPMVQRMPASTRTTTHNLVGAVDAPPIWVPQLSFGLRYADRIIPRAAIDKLASVKKAAGRHVEDHMAGERWDFEANAIVYLNSANDFSRFTNNNQAVVSQSLGADGTLGLPINTVVGSCIGVDTPNCVRQVPTYFHGKTQYSVRLGGDYNILPGVFSVRLGFSYETNGQDPSYLNITNYMLGRTGLHAGATLRVAEKTDISIGFAHFIQQDVRLVPNPSNVPPNKVTMDPAKYHVVTGANDGVAKFAIPDSATIDEGPQFANAGSFYYHLDVVSVALAQHF